MSINFSLTLVLYWHNDHKCKCKGQYHLHSPFIVILPLSILFLVNGQTAPIKLGNLIEFAFYCIPSMTMWETCLWHVYFTYVLEIILYNESQVIVQYNNYKYIYNTMYKNLFYLRASKDCRGLDDRYKGRELLKKL